MIPKKIHYCWFGGNPKPKLFERCLKSWKKYCPDYEIIEWNESNFDLSSCPLYVRQAYEVKKWAFVTDYARLKIIYENGGVYFDTDVELKNNIDFLLENKAFFGFERGQYIATGLGFGAEKDTPILLEIMQDYNNTPFIKEDGSYNLTPCPLINTKIFLKHNLIPDDSKQILDDGILILPTIYLCPIDYKTGKIKHSKRTLAIHWFTASWVGIKHKTIVQERKSIKRKNLLDNIMHIPNKALILVLGKNNYERLKSKLKQR